MTLIFNKILEQNIFFIGAFALGLLLLCIIISIIFLASTFYKTKNLGKIIRIIFLAILVPEMIYILYWFGIFLGMLTGDISQFPI